MGDAVKPSPGTEMDDTAAAPHLRQAERDDPQQGHGNTPASSGASQGDFSPNSDSASSHLATEGDLDALAPENSPMGDSDGMSCDKCSNPAELLLLLDDLPPRCFNCCLIAAMKRPCSICGQHITEAITRALDQQGKPNTIGVCAQCFMKAVAAQRN